MAASDRIGLGVAVLLVTLGVATSNARGQGSATRAVPWGGAITQVAFGVGREHRLMRRAVIPEAGR
ncbi:hypothetical protein [Roseobacter sp.]